MNRTISILNKYKVLLAALTGSFLILFGVAFRPAELIAILFCIGVSCLSEDDLLATCCLVCWVSLATIFKLSVDGKSYYTYAVILFAAKRLLRDKHIDKDFFLILVIYGIYLIMGMGDEHMAMIKNVLMPLQLYTMAKCLDYQGLKQVSGYFILGNIIGSTAAMFNTMIPNLSSYITTENVFALATIGGYVPKPRFSGLLEDPNYYSIHLLMGIIICILLYSRREIRGYVFYGVVAVLTFFGAKTLSKSFILMLALALVYAYFLFIRQRQFGSVAMISVLLLAFLILVAAGYVDAFSMILKRLSEGMSSGGDITTGRTVIWKNYLYYYYTHPIQLLFGIGIGGQGPFTLQPHNSYLEIILYLGLTGTLIFCMTIYNAVAASWPRPLRGSAAPFLFILMMYFFLGIYMSADFQVELLLILGYLWLNNDEKVLET